LVHDKGSEDVTALFESLHAKKWVRELKTEEDKVFSQEAFISWAIEQ